MTSMAVGAVAYEEPGRIPSAVLAVLVHLLLAVFLVFSVRWQNNQPAAVAVELWNSLPAPAVQEIEPRPKIKLAPAPVPVPAPVPKPEIRPEPKVEKTIEPPKPDIALEKKKKEIRKEAPKKAEPEPKKPEPRLKLDRSKDIRAQAEREAAALDQQLEKNRILGEMRREAAALTSKAKDAWIGAIVRKIKPNVQAQPNIPGNPEAVFDVTLLPNGELLAVRLRKSSGYKSYDDALERAILKSSPLPKPDRPELFERSLELKFRPLD